MKSITISQARSDMDAVLDAAQKERIVLTRGGKPSAILVGLESYDNEDRELASSPEFWKMIEERHHSGRLIPWNEAKARLGAARSARGKSGKKSKRASGGTRSKSR